MKKYNIQEMETLDSPFLFFFFLSFFSFPPPLFFLFRTGMGGEPYMSNLQVRFAGWLN